ncbi:hypothetical protein FG152_13585 [Ochrobactrum sp. XJ1]|nr:hypothetical protein [Ochrobactrum sp. XJ1]
MSDKGNPSPADILDEILRQGTQVPTDQPEPVSQIESDPDSIDRELDFERLKAFKNHHDSKKQWSDFMIDVMTILIGFQMVLLIMVGFGWWDFSKYEWLLPLLLVQNFAQIVGLALVVVRSLFDSFKE